MIGLFVRLLLVLAGFLTSLFIARDALNFSIIQMVVAVLLFTILVAIIAFFPHWLNFKFGRRHYSDKDSNKK